MIIKPNVLKNKLNEYDLENIFLNDELVISKLIDKKKFNNIDLEDIEINTCIIKDAKFISSKIIKSYFVDVIFENCDLSNINLTKYTFK